ncbi:UDP-N-acetylmuramate dehydrogenase [Embleya scabrispora]|uniref:UDP-N-acetylmuramate dehydrogenase n=1 Tax=Embleya scabrispora TaxID=159449 RepID=UPI00036DAD35|nr:UDP-N-acetylmuramate dehydrogenase [Embleya scabrispora]MYS79131.1 UDP-N-acetylmuramate dehydrogenase [Streptomyces sp. SID5474]
MGDLLADHTTLRLGGPADRLHTHTDPLTWPDLVARLPCRPWVLGTGSNVLAPDAGHRGVVVIMATRGITTTHGPHGTVEVTARAGEPLANLVAHTVAHGLSGIEYLTGIPGTAGAAPVQNAGAYGQEIADTLTTLTTHDHHTGRTVRLTREQCRFGYRTSRFKTEPRRFTILDVTLRLTPRAHAAPITYRHLAQSLDVPLGATPPLAEAAAGVAADRRARGLLLPTHGPDARQVGSVFLNPPVTAHQATALRAAGGPVHRTPDGTQRASAGWLIQQLGHQPDSPLGPGIWCSTLRALTIVARENATATAFADTLVGLVTDVETTFGIRLHPEPTTPH